MDMDMLRNGRIRQFAKHVNTLDEKAKFGIRSPRNTGSNPRIDTTTKHLPEQGYNNWEKWWASTIPMVY
jgi:hypothetical protein